MPAADSPSRQYIGPYRIVSRVGAGGMGEVFKAWDPRLERDVAIKVLHSDAAGNADHQRQLLAEGRAASALNHPNILRVYDADVDGTTYYLVSEWLEGRSLRDELSRGPLPVKRLLDLAVQIADGLAAAHAMGIVHRDIKPENVMLARDGTARIVDFGLARLDPRSPARSDAAAQHTTVTLDGGLSGTPAYMSPEQARGTQGDFRTDQFSFGALLYEMATGRHAFRRESMADTLAAVLHDEPKPITQINARVPPAFSWVVEQCLAKDAAERYGATEDLARELRRVRDRQREAALVEQGAGTTGRWPRPWLAAAVAGVAVAIAMPMAMPPAAAPNLRFTPIASEAQYEGTPVWSPDGQSLAWVSDSNGVLQIFARRLTDAVPTQLTRGRFDAEEPFWAPDGRSLYFISRAADGLGLWTVGSAGGRAELVLENVTHASIDRSGAHLALMRIDGDVGVFQRLWWASPDGSNLVREMRPPFDSRGFGLGGQLLFAPDGQHLLAWAFTAVQQEGEPVSSYLLVPRDRSRPIAEVLTTITSQANLQPVSWMPDSRHVVVAAADASGGNRHLWLADTQSTSLQRITATHTNETWPSVSPDGRRIAYASEEVDFDLIAFSNDGRRRETTLATARNEMDPAWSPEGDQFAFVTDRTGEMAIWLRSRDGQWERPIVTAADFPQARTDTFGSLAFSPDGRTLAYQRRGPDQASIWLTPITGGTPIRLIDEGATLDYQDAPAWSPDGESIAFVRSNGPQFSVARVNVGSTATIQLLDRVIPFARPAWSPDGKWLICETFDGIVKVPTDGGTPVVMLAESLLAFAWAEDGRRVIALAESEVSGHLSMIEIDSVTHDVKTLNEDLGTIPIANQPIRGFSHNKAGGFLTSLASARSDIWLLEGFAPPPNWRERLLRWRRP